MCIQDLNRFWMEGLGFYLLTSSDKQLAVPLVRRSTLRLTQGLFVLLGL